ncbi:hypothetical protein B9Z48_07440 [Limnohabitans sp. WS1]|nr:hypothetical protein B9Z48_07440 [Limnohabitans sp. WS1]
MGRGLRGLIATRASLLQVQSLVNGPGIHYLQEPRPRGDGPWSARLDRDEGVVSTSSVIGQRPGIDFL